VAQTAQQLEMEQRWPEARERWVSALQWLPEETQQAASVRQHVAQIDARAQAEADRKARWTKKLGPFAPIALFLLKIKSFFFILLKLKFLLSMVAFFGIYWALFGWKFAAGFTVGLLIHEMGHYIAAKRRGLKVDLPTFIPGMGAYVRWYSQGTSREDLARIALAGPLFGLSVAAAFLGLWFVWHADVFMVLAYVTAWVNFLNLVPILGLDGAQATYALSKMQRGMIAATCLLFFALTVRGGNLMGDSTQWIFLIVALGMGWRCFTRDEPEKGSTTAFAFFQSLVVVLGLVVIYTYPMAGMAT
jgi:Zn-dependent protease